MSLEAKIEALTTALNENTAALKGAKAPAAAGKTTPATTTTGKGAAKPKNTIDQVKAAAVKVKDGISTEKAKELIASEDGGNATELAKIKPENYDKFVAACEAALEEAAGSGEDEGGL